MCPKDNLSQKQPIPRQLISTTLVTVCPSDGYEPLQARALLELARKLAARKWLGSKNARKNLARKMLGSKLARKNQARKLLDSNFTKSKLRKLYFLYICQDFSIMHAKYH